MKKIILASSIVLAAFALCADAQSYQFLTNLQVGSTGQDVTALQTWLIANGYSIPAISSGAAAKGRFGSQTKTAVMQYQKAVGLPVTGFVGPLTRAKLDAAGGSSVSVASASQACPAGFTCVPQSGTASSAASASGAASAASSLPFPPGFNTPGAQGIMSVTQGPVSNSTLYAGQKRAPIMDVRIQAQYSDLVVAGIDVDLGTSTAIYNYVFSTLYIVDPTTNTVLATVPLNSSTVVQVSGQYLVGTQGYEFVVPKGTYKDLVVEADLYPNINTTYTNESPWYVSIDPNTVGAVDGVGQDLYGPASGSLVEALTIQQSLITNATANISLDSSSPLVSSVAVTNTTSGQYLGLPVLVFDVNAQGDNLHLHNVNLNFALSGSGSVTAAYLYNGSTLVASGAVSGNTASFTNIADSQAGANIPINTTVPFTVKVDVSNLTGTGATESITASTSALTIYNSIDSNITANTVAQGNTVTVFGQGPVFSLAGAPTITKTNITPGGSSTTTLVYTASFNLNAQAVGENVVFALPSLPSNASFGSSTTGANIAQVWQNGAPATGIGTVSSYSQPTNTTLSSNGNYFTLAQNQSVTIPVTYSFTVTNPGANTYAVQLNGIQWFTSTLGAGTTTTAFMANQPGWRTPSN